MISPADRDMNNRLMRRATQASVMVAVTLMLLKAYAYLISDSLAMLASLLDSGLDFLASAVNLLAVRHATTPPDEDHRFGHEKAEPLASLAQAAFIMGSAGFLGVEAVQHLIRPQALSDGQIGIWVSGVAIVMTIGLLAYQRYVVQKTGSMLVSADALHYKSDLLTNLAVMASLIGTDQFNLPSIDAAAGMAIALVIAHSALAVFRQAYDQLMDREAPDDMARQIDQLARANPHVSDVHDIRTRRAGSRIFVQMHLELDPTITLLRAHEISDAVEISIRQAYPQADIMIHQDPAGYEMPPKS
jgi:ferrous-iron efflux pump FieF